MDRRLLSHNNANGVACKTRSKPPPSPASLAVRSTPRAKRTCLLALLESEMLSRRACVFAVQTKVHFYVYEYAN